MPSEHLAPGHGGDTTATAPRRGVATAASAGLVIAWSSGFIGAELGHRAEAAPLPLLTWRFAVLSLLLLTACAVTGTSLRAWRAWRRQAALALPSQVIYLVLVFEGVSHGVHGGTAALIAALQPLLVMTVAGRLLGESASRQAWLGTGIGFAGVAVVVSGDIGADQAPHWAYLFPAVAMISLSAGTVLARRLDPPETLLQTITMQSVITGTVITIVTGSTGRLTLAHNGETLAAVAWLVLVPSILGYGLYVFVTRSAGATVVSTLLYLTPPTTMLWAYLMFGDAITAAGLAGLTISAIGVFLVLRSRRAPRASRT
jgi:drug/metabolite transporter (DMT)-like permease